jgi:hypothetical protein
MFNGKGLERIKRKKKSEEKSGMGSFSENPSFEI